MSNKWDFYGKDVAEAITVACTELEKSQENLNIDIIETGSAGFFGFAKKKAHIQVSLKEEKSKTPDKSFAVAGIFDSVGDSSQEGQQHRHTVTAATVDIVEREVMRLVGLSGYSCSHEVSVEKTTVHVSLCGENSEGLIGEEGKVLDALQYLVRKIVGRQVEERISIVLDVNGYRKKRLEELRKDALRLAESVRKNGRPQIIPSLNPAERREVHLALQNERGVYSRSIGDGIFRRIVISRAKKREERKPRTNYKEG